MLKNYLEVGQIVGTHGLRGEVRLDPWCSGAAFIRKFKTLYFDADGKSPVSVLSAREHGNIVILKLACAETIEEAEKLRGKKLWLRRADASLDSGEWFIEELIGCRVLDADSPEICYGTLTEVASTKGANDVWYITKGDVETPVPAIPDVVIRCDVVENTVYIRPIRGLFDAD